MILRYIGAVKPLSTRCLVANLLRIAGIGAVSICLASVSAQVRITRAGPPEIYPNAGRNPGFANPDVTQANLAKTICNKKWSTDSIRPSSRYTTALKIRQIAQYGFADKNAAGYEEDHIISLENGGHPTDERNLYPEAYNTKVGGKTAGAREKDRVENYVHNGICLDIPNAKFSSGPKPPHALTLKQAQDILAGDWYACYRHMLKIEDCR